MPKRALTMLLATVAAVALTATAGAKLLAAAPNAVTGSASAIAASTATLAGKVNPNGTATTYQFEYGTTTAYGSKAPATAASAGSGTSDVSVSVSLTGLTVGTTYHYRLTASSTGGTTVGSDATFTTQAAPAVTTGATTNPGSNQATVACSIDPNGLSTTWTVEYGTSTSYGTQTSSQSIGSGGSVVNVSTTLTGLETGKTFHYRCDATNSAGTTHGSDATFLTAAAPSVTTHSATSVSTTSAKLNATINPNGRSTTYYFDYGQSTSYGSKTSSASAGNGTSTVSVSQTVTGLQAGTNYHFRIVASSDGGTSHGSDVSLVTNAAPAVTPGTVAQVGATSAVVGGAVTPNGHSTTWYVEYGTSPSYGSKTSSANAGSGTNAVPVSTTLTGLHAGVLYHYRIVATNSAGTTRGSDATFTTIGPPVAITGQVPIGALSPTGATVTGVVNAHGLTATVWFEYGRTNAYGQRTPVMQVPASITDQAVSVHLTGLAPGVRYHFRLVAMSAAGSVAGTDKSFGTPGMVVDGHRCTIVGTQGPDVLVGTPGNDVICGLGGNDIIKGGGGNDILIGGAGNDVIYGGPGNDILYGDTGNDILRGNAGADKLFGGPGNDRLLGGPGIDTIDGGPGSDTVYAGGKDHVVRVEHRIS